MLNMKSKELIHEAYELHHAGMLTTAEKLYNKLLEEQPEHIDVLFLLGTLNLQRGNNDTACTHFMKTLALKPDHAMAHCNLGTALQKSGKLDKAIESYNKSISLNPDYADAHYNLGNALRELGQLKKAAESYEQAILYRQDYVDAYYNLGNVLKEQCKPNKALDCFRKTISLKPDYAIAHCNLGSVLQELGKLDEAISSYNTAITLKPDYAMAYCNLGSAFQELGKINEAITAYKKALLLKPDFVMAYCNLGSALQETGLLNEAKECYKKAIVLNPDYAMAYSNLGSILQEFSNIDEAIENYDRAIALNPDEPTAHKNKSIALLLQGNFTEGWLEYEWRLKIKEHCLRDFRKPRWDGSPLNGKTILVHAEQGFGDTIQFARYLPMVKARGGHVIFECHKNLSRLLRRCAGIDRIIERVSDTIPEVQFDSHIPLLSLPGLFGTTLDSIPSDDPYVTVDSSLVEKWNMRLCNDSNFKIGIVWAGNPSFKNYHNRSCSLFDFTALAEITGLSFYSLQKESDLNKNDTASVLKITDLKNELNDFADTAAVMSNLDLVISTDTSVVHLAGALGVPVWTLLHSTPDWRWWLKRTDSPWYTNMRLFRQTQLNDWAGVFAKVKVALIQEVNNLPTLTGKPVGYEPKHTINKSIIHNVAMS
ncbi:MAG: tetratricopeptide repeat protein [Candidatus Brocadiales bacterium]|nr:tetratricopeptide repeat protein [Candidatus Brocadiales bacterium]